MISSSVLAAAAVLILAASACVRAELECPPGTTPVGGPPPVGRQLFCERSPGERHGPTINWHANGQKSFELEYVDGHPAGPIAAWWQSGQRAVAGYISPRNGWLILWDEAGRKRAEVEVRDRRPTIKVWDENGREEPYDESKLFPRNHDLHLVMMLFAAGSGIM